MPRPTPTQLDDQAAQLRARAAALTRAHDLEDGRFTRGMALANTDARMSRSTAERVATEANEYRIDARIAEQQGQRAQAQEHGRNAVKAERAAREQTARADRAEQEVARLERAQTDSRPQLEAIQQAGGQLETKAVALEQAATTLRSASTARPAARQRLVNEADQAIARSEALPVVDLTHIEPRIFIDAGVPLTEVPGAELIDPATESSAPRASVDSFDDPVDPTGADAFAAMEVDPVNGVAAPSFSDEIPDDGLMEDAPVASGVDPGTFDPSGTTLPDFGPVVAAVDPLDEPAADFAPDPTGGDEFADAFATPGDHDA